MTKKKINIVIIIMVIFIAVFFAGSFAYESYKMGRDDQEYSDSLDRDLDQTQKDNASGSTNDEMKQS